MHHGRAIMATDIAKHVSRYWKLIYESTTIYSNEEMASGHQ